MNVAVVFLLASLLALPMASAKRSEISATEKAANWIRLFPGAAAEEKFGAAPDVPVLSCGEGADLSPEDIARKLEDETLPDLVTAEPPDFAFLKRPPLAECTNPGEIQKSRTATPALIDKPGFSISGEASVEVHYEICWQQAPTVSCSQRSFGRYLKQQAQRHECERSGSPALSSSELQKLLEHFDTKRKCAGTVCNLYREVLQKAQAALQNGQVDVPDELRPFVLAVILDQDEALSLGLSEEVLAAVYSALLVSIQRLNPPQVQAEAPHLLKATIVSCRKHSWQRRLRETYKVTMSGTSDEFNQGSHEYSPGQVGEGQKAPADESCPIIEGRAICP